jgi:hypothetical protein
MGCVNSTTSKSVNAVTRQAFGHTITNWSRPRGFDSGRSLFAKTQTGDAAALRYSVTLIEIPEAPLPIGIGDEDTRSLGASLPMIDFGARANNSGRDLDLIAHTGGQKGSAFLPIDIGDEDTRSSGASLPIDLGDEQHTTVGEIY